MSSSIVFFILGMLKSRVLTTKKIEREREREREWREIALC
jgi:hypothetical protein